MGICLLEERRQFTGPMWNEGIQGWVQKDTFLPFLSDLEGCKSHRQVYTGGAEKQKGWFQCVLYTRADQIEWTCTQIF